MMSKSNKSWREIGTLLVNINEQCNSILSDLILDRTDARGQGLVHIRQLCNTTAYTPLVLNEQAEKAPLFVSELLRLPQSDLKSFLKDFNNNSKAAFVTNSQFAFENMLKLILAHLSVAAPKNFYSSAQEILTICNIENKDQKLKMLMLPARIRNSLHNNGIHNKNSEPKLVIDNLDFEFIKGERVQCASWEHLLTLLKRVLMTYKEILNNPRIKSITSIPTA